MIPGLLSGLHTLWEAGHGVASTQGLAHAWALGVEKGDRIPGLAQDSTFKGKSLENECKSRNRMI